MCTIDRFFMPSIFLFLYIYPLFLNGVPISSRVIFGILGFITILLKGNLNLDKIFLRPLNVAIYIVIISMITAIYNATYDFYFAFYIISIAVIFFAGYLFTFIFKRIIAKHDFITLVLRLFVYAIVAQSVIAVIFFVSPGIYSATTSIFPNTALYEEDTNIIGFRLIGLGSAFFRGGVINGLALITIIYLYHKNNIKKSLIWAGIYLFILFVGIMIARTTIIGLGISILYLILGKCETKRNSFLKKSKWIVSLFCITSLLAVFAIQYVDEQLLKFGFEFFYNYEKTGNFESASTNRLQEMYILPDNLKTWIIGDGKYNTADGHYYMSTDVGYLRLLFYGGLPMVLAFYYFSWCIIKQIYVIDKNRSLHIFLIYTFIYLLILGFKGLADLNSFYLLICACTYMHMKLMKRNKLSSYSV